MDWADNLPSVLMSYRANVATPLGVSPHYALFGRPMTVGIDTMLLTDMETSPDIQRYTAELIPRLKIVQDAVRENLKDSNVSSKQVYDRKSKEPNFELGSTVLLHDPTTKKGECPKLKQRWKGPYLIVDKDNNGLLYKLRHCTTGKEQRSVVHSNRLKAFNEDKEAFYDRNSPEPANVPSSTQSQTDGQQLDDDWNEIFKVSRKKVGGKDTYLVHWTYGTTSLQENPRRISQTTLRRSITYLKASVRDDAGASRVETSRVYE